jgi:hypothetical protein
MCSRACVCGSRKRKQALAASRAAKRLSCYRRQWVVKKDSSNGKLRMIDVRPQTGKSMRYDGGCSDAYVASPQIVQISQLVH